MSRTRKQLMFAVVAAVLAAASIGSAVYAAGSGVSKGGAAGSSSSPQASISITNCKTAKTDFITNDTTGLSTTSTSYVAVPGMTKTITVAGSVPSCVVVDVSGFAFAAGGALEYVSVTIDGSQGNPTETQFAGDTKGAFAEAHASVFAFADIAPGAHTVSLVFRSLDGKTVFLHRPAMQIGHK